MSPRYHRAGGACVNANEPIFVEQNVPRRMGVHIRPVRRIVEQSQEKETLSLALLVACFLSFSLVPLIFVYGHKRWYDVPNACLRSVAFIPLAGKVQSSFPFLHFPSLCFHVAEPRLSLMYDFINAGFTYSLDLNSIVVVAPATKTGTCTTCTFSSSIRELSRFS